MKYVAYKGLDHFGDEEIRIVRKGYGRPQVGVITASQFDRLFGIRLNDNELLTIETGIKTLEE